MAFNRHRQRRNQSVRKRCARVILDKKWDTPSGPFFRYLNVIPLFDKPSVLSVCKFEQIFLFAALSLTFRGYEAGLFHAYKVISSCGLCFYRFFSDRI